jgi:sulfate transport system permease protein
LTAAFSTARPKLKSPSILPGFGLALGYTLLYLGLIVLFPLAVLIAKASSIGVPGVIAAAAEPRVAAALRTSFGLALAAAVIDVICGGVIAWVLSRYRFFGRRLLDALVDLPFALPTAVAGIAFAALYAGNGWLGAPLARLGIKVAFTPIGILVAMVFVGMPFVVRTVEPIIGELERELEEASATLGASRFQTLWRVLVPPLVPALLTGMALAFARAVGEYGSVIFVAGNLPYVSEIAPLLIVVKLEEFDYAGATAIATVMLAIAFLMLLAINLIEGWSRKRFGYV